jgi:thiamine-phosphate pyrophosphorylase
VLALTSDAICRRADYGIQAAALLSVGPGLAIVVKATESTREQQVVFLERTLALARPTEASVYAYGDPELAAETGAHGVQLRLDGHSPAAARTLLPRGRIGMAAHDTEEATRAAQTGADYLLAGNVFPSPSDPDLPAHGVEWITRIATLGTPVVAIGGVTLTALPALRAAGAWGVAAQGALWDAPDPAKAASQFLDAWTGE